MVMFLALDLVKSVESLCFWGVVSGVASAMHWHQEAARIQHPRGLQHAQGYQRKGFCQSLFFLKYIQQAFSCVLPLVSFLLLRDWCLLFVIRSLRIFFSPGNIQAFRRISQPGGKSNLHWSLVYLVLVRFSWVNRLCASGLYTEGVGRVCGWRKSLDKMSACADECPRNCWTALLAALDLPVFAWRSDSWCQCFDRLQTYYLFRVFIPAVGSSMTMNCH